MFSRRTRERWAVLGLSAAMLVLGSACGNADDEPETADGSVDAGSSADCGDFPSRNITMVIGRSAGGGHDEYGRFLVPLIEEELGETVVIENVDGAGGRVAATEVQSAEPDGYTIHLMEPNGLAALQAVEEVDYDLTAFTMLGTVNDRPSTFAVAADSDIETFEDLVAAGQETPLRFATAGLTSPNFVNGVIAAQAEGMQLTPVPHEGSSEAIVSVVRGDSDFTVFSGDSIAEAVEAGDLRALVQFGNEPLDTLPDVPLATDVGLDDLSGVLTTNLILVAPPDLPECVSTLLTDAVQNSLNSEAFAEYGAEGRIVTPGTPDETAQLIEDAIGTYEEYADVFREYLAS